MECWLSIHYGVRGGGFKQQGFLVQGVGESVVHSALELVADPTSPSLCVLQVGCPGLAAPDLTPINPQSALHRHRQIGRATLGGRSGSVVRVRRCQPVPGRRKSCGL